MSRCILLLAIAALLAWALTDQLRPRHLDLRQFDPHEIARLETSMWRSYYDGRRAALFLDLNRLLRSQYGLSWLRAQFAAWDAARSAVVFQRGRERREYELALPNLRSFYAAIRRDSATAFDIDQAARLELEWWIVHRERARYGPPALERALADLQSCLYRQPAERFQTHAAARAEAMALRDRGAGEGGVSRAGWQQIHQLLDRSWESLHSAVNPPAPR